MVDGNFKKKNLLEYFKQSGIDLDQILENLKDNFKAWQEFKKTICHNIKYCYKYKTLVSLKKIDDKYLIIKLHSWDYLIIDLELLKVLRKDEVIQVFNEDFFVCNFNEKKSNYIFINDCKNVLEVVDAFYQYESFLTSDVIFKYNVSDYNSNSIFVIDLINDCCYIDFYSEEMNVKERYYFTNNLKIVGLFNEKIFEKHDKYKLVSNGLVKKRALKK